MVVKVYGVDGSEQRSIDLADEVFNRSVSTGSIYHAIRNELANLRVGTASTKTRSEVRGSGTKPWRQKGTGRARAGTRQSPVWVGGGVVFGPRPRDYSYKIPKKVKRLAFKSIFSQKTREERLLVVEDFTVESGKTKELVKILRQLTPENRTAIVISGEDSMLKRAGRNVPGLSILSFNRLRAHDLFYAGRVIVFEKAAESLGRMYGEFTSKRRPARHPAVTKTLEGAKPVALEKKQEPAAPKKGAPKAASDGSKAGAAKKAASKAAPATASEGSKASAAKPAATRGKPSAGKAKTGTAPAAKAPGTAKAASSKTKTAAAGSKPQAKASATKPAAKKAAPKKAAPKKAAPKKAAPEKGQTKAANGGSGPSKKKAAGSTKSKGDS
jgi:large subunit ribosomal protein L4